MRMIDGDKLIEESESGCWDIDLKELRMILKYVPTIDAAPVVHGEWVEAKLNGMSLYPFGQKMCSVCGQIMPSRWKTMPPFCYGCGAKMNAESEAGK